MATKRHKAEKNQYNTNITKTTADIALTNVFEVTNTLPSGNNFDVIKNQCLCGFQRFQKTN